MNTAGSELSGSFVQLAVSVAGRVPSALHLFISFGLSTLEILVTLPVDAVIRTGTWMAGESPQTGIGPVDVQVSVRPEVAHDQKLLPFTDPVYSTPAGRISFTVVVPVLAAGPTFTT